jgi:hypothetical protein
MRRPERRVNRVASRLSVAVSICLATLMVFAGGAGASSALFKNIPPSDVNTDQVEQGSRIVTSLYARWQVGAFEPLSDQFTAEMQKGLTPQLQEQAFHQIRNMFGDFQDLTFVEAMTARFFFPRGIIYRYKGTYSRTSEQPEIRVVFDATGKVSGLWIKPWKDELQ